MFSRKEVHGGSLQDRCDAGNEETQDGSLRAYTKNFGNIIRLV